MKLLCFLVFVICTNLIDCRSFGEKRKEKLTKEERKAKKEARKNKERQNKMNSSMDHAAGMQMQATGFESKKNGRWHGDSTWNKSGTPAACCNVVVKAGHNISVRGDVSAKTIRIFGRLRFSRNKDSNVEVETIIIERGGSLEIGSANRPINEKNKVIITFVTDGKLDHKSQMFTHQLGLINKGGTLILNGKKIDRVIEAEVSGKTLELIDSPEGWTKDDTLMTPSTTFNRNQELDNQVTTIADISGKQVSLSDSIKAGKLPAGKKRVVANLSSNIILQSKESLDLNQRGHVMIMSFEDDQNDCGVNIINGVTFKNLGRTNKNEIISTSNQKMMYPLHFHHCGFKRAYTVENSVAWNSPGWSFVNHRSNVNFKNNVAFEFRGAGFVTEFGSERGSFEGNLAAGGEGVYNKKKNRVYPYRRLYITNEMKDRLRQADLGFHGDGFWMTSPFVELADNTAAGNHGAGFTWYLLGLDDDVKSQSDKGKVIMGTHRFNDMPKNAQNILVDSKPKRWYSAAPNEYIHQDLPLFEKIDNNMAYANHVGMRIRYVANINLVAASSFHELEEPDKLENYIKGETDTKKLHVHSSLISNTTLLNNEIGLHSTYSSNIKYQGLTISSNQYSLDLEYKKSNTYLREQAPTGVELNHTSNRNHSIENLQISGYPICMRVTEQLVKYSDAGLKDCSGKYRELVLDQNTVRGMRR